MNFDEWIVKRNRNVVPKWFSRTQLSRSMVYRSETLLREKSITKTKPKNFGISAELEKTSVDSVEHLPMELLAQIVND